MGFERLGSVAINREAVENAFGELVPGVRAAVDDISIANGMGVVSKNPSQPFVQAHIEREPSLELRAFSA
jgi:hypothetical protein